MRNSYSLTDLSQSLEWSRGRFTDLTDEDQIGKFYTRLKLLTITIFPGGPSRVSSPIMMRRRLVSPDHTGQPGHHLTRVLSSDSVSSGYSTGVTSGDMYLPVDTDTMDTGDYELWERRYQHLPQQPAQHQHQYEQPTQPQHPPTHGQPRRRRDWSRNRAANNQVGSFIRG